ncbi:MAG: hypothetical protein GX162_00575 [Firmicutes bacterium]|jgi:ABC-type lipopolysaccharide export system ATPase subunit|nr:hypothetical protein [Bacillota bacterium]
MEGYPFADLDPTDVEEIRQLELRLTQKTGRDVILIAYHVDQETEDGSITAQLSEPAEYGPVVTAMESGLRM